MIEISLDRLCQSVAAGRMDPDLFRHVRELIVVHYLREDAFLVRWHAHEPAVAAKLRAQHEEALEIAARLEECLASSEDADVTYLARRFLAIAQHNMIEEERDVFPLARRFLSEEE